MAGSYKHCKSESGSFRFDLIENMGDAHEACHQMFWMIHILSRGRQSRIADAERVYYEMARGERSWPVGNDDETTN